MRVSAHVCYFTRDADKDLKREVGLKMWSGPMHVAKSVVYIHYQFQHGGGLA